MDSRFKYKDVSIGMDQSWVESRLRLRLPEARLFAKMPVSRPASASQHSKVVGFGLGFVIFLTAGFGFGFGFPESCVWLPRFNRRFDKTFFHKLLFDLY